jgi:hypothetical protein
VSDTDNTTLGPTPASETEEFLENLFEHGAQGLFDHNTRRKVTIELPTLDALGVTEEAPTIEVESNSDGSNLTITARATSQARSQQEYDAIIHLLATAL